VHARLADRLARAGLPLLAQHVDPIDPGTLVDIFRDDPARVAARHRCASRRGRRSRRIAAAGGDGASALAAADGASFAAADGQRRQRYDDRVVRARLAQAFGRLIRREGDCGVFVILSAAMPSRLLAPFRRASRSAG
jgi:ATP-dependent DNA helicase DinG